MNVRSPEMQRIIFELSLYGYKATNHNADKGILSFTNVGKYLDHESVVANKNNTGDNESSAIYLKHMLGTEVTVTESLRRENVTLYHNFTLTDELEHWNERSQTQAFQPEYDADGVLISHTVTVPCTRYLLNIYLTMPETGQRLHIGSVWATSENIKRTLYVLYRMRKAQSDFNVQLHSSRPYARKDAEDAVYESYIMIRNAESHAYNGNKFSDEGESK